MKKCLACKTPFESETWACPTCHWQADCQDNIPQFAPDVAETNDGFSPESFDALYETEAGNFWFRARNKIILNFIRKHFSTAKNFMEVGCGTGFVLSAIQRYFPNLSCTGTEIYTSGLVHAAKRVGKSTQLCQMDGQNILFAEEFDIIGAFDCLEHISDDEKVLREMHAALKKGGGVIFTVPQHPFLWSADDERACHKRRYKRGELEEKMRRAGFKVVDSTSFVTALLPFMMIDRLMKPAGKPPAQDKGDNLSLPKPINTLFYTVMMAEIFFISAGLRLPFGGSRLVVGRKDKEM